MNLDQSYVIAAFIAMGAAIVALALAIGRLWIVQTKQSTLWSKKFEGLEERLRNSILLRCIRRKHSDDDIPCIGHSFDDCISRKQRDKKYPETSGDDSVVLVRKEK